MRLYGEPGWGSAIVEAQLDFYGLPYDFEAIGDLFRSAESRDRLAPVNPVMQVPTLVLPNGEIMTESAAITMLLAEQTGNDALVPPPGDADRARFLRWLVFIVANVYPTYTYGDDPSRFVSNSDCRNEFRTAVDEYAMKMYLILESEAAAPWFLGKRFSALDIYLCVMTTWRPRRTWFARNAPKLHAIAAATEKLDALVPAWQRNFKAS